MDWEREARTGLCEAVFAEGKTVACLAGIVERAAAESRRLLVTRLAAAAFDALPAPARDALDYDEVSRTAILGPLAAAPEAHVAVVSAGLSDAPVAREVGRTLHFAGVGARQIADVGVAGLWRLMARLEEIRGHRVVVVVAGMEGALFSVLAGLVSAPLIAVPTSVGYGVGAGGHLAFHSALGSCAPGVVAVNIDNGFGGAQAALRILNLLRASGTP
ncbi:MAG TPA: nickel pincer cofactor biosynthesis protein LarB [Rhodocyclaceae bacterium]|nr:nickel pincer cofactor biosynthesis protein LarB [Rhodocyclaceae bacterium]